MKTGIMLRGAAALIILTGTTPGLAVQVPLDTTSASNGITDLYSATFDPALVRCSGGSPSYCAFFGGDPPAVRTIVITPNPTGVINAIPLGFAVVPPSGSYLDLTLNGTNTQLTITGGTLAFPSLLLTIQGTTVVTANSAGGVFGVAPQTATLDADGQAEFFVELAPSIAVDFSAFLTVAFPPIGSCAGPLCSLISILTLDMVRYRLLVDYDPTFTYFTASFIGQTANNSMLFITMNSVAPEIQVTNSVTFGDVTELTSATQTVTVTNTGGANLLLGAIALSNPLDTSFAIGNNTCTANAATLPPSGGKCTFDVTFSPGFVGTFNNTLDIPSNDADEPSVTVAVSGNGVTQLVPNISVSDSTIAFGSVAIGAPVDQSVTVTNVGNADLVLGSVVDALAAPFSVVDDNNCSGRTLTPGLSCTIGVRFDPTAAGEFNAAFDIPSNDAADPTVPVSVSGTGTSLAVPAISVTDNTVPANDLLVPFGNVTEGTIRDRTITVTNVGGADLVVDAIGYPNPEGPFTVVIDNCSDTTLLPTDSCTTVVRYTPTATGVLDSDSLSIPSNDPDPDDDPVPVSLTGTGITLGEGGVGTPEPTGTDSGFMAIDPATLLLLGAAGAWGWRRRRAH